jgi:aminoglycoside/choline kinase family phosphotransferase
MTMTTQSGRPGPEAAQERVACETARNFIWLGDLNRVMEQYERERDRYPKFVDFMPRIVEYFDQLAPRVPEMAKRAGMC